MEDIDKYKLSAEELEKVVGGKLENITDCPQLVDLFRNITESHKRLGRPLQRAIDQCIETTRVIFGDIPFEPGVIDAYVSSIWPEV